MWWMTHNRFTCYVTYNLSMKQTIWAFVFLNLALVSTNCCSMAILFPTMVEKCSYTLYFCFVFYLQPRWNISPLVPYYPHLLKQYQKYTWDFELPITFLVSLVEMLTCFITFSLQCHQLSNASYKGHSWWSLIMWNFICNLVILVLFVNCVKLLLTNNWSPQKSRDGSQHSGVEF